jgi:hypothetical protein
MRIVAIAALAIGLVVPDLAAAQGSRPSGGQAPVGHRQPTAKDVPGQSTPPVTVTKEDRALDKALKGICRGC